MLHLKLLEKQEQEKPRTRRRGKIIKIRADINEIETKKQKNKKKSFGSLKKINKIDKPLANMTKMWRENTQISKIRNKRGKITTNTKEIQESSETTLRNCITINWKILKKWTNF
jgi:hypothetical protein